MTDVDPLGTSANDRTRQLVSALRLSGVVLLLFGFSGWVLDGGGEVSLESPFTLAFGLGIAAAVASIYLGVFLANRD